MKTLRFISLLAIVAAVSAIAACNKEKKRITEIPVTTSSQEALQSVRQGLAYADQGDDMQAKASYAKAVEQDPKCAVAWLLKATYSDSPKEFREALDKAKENLAGTSFWEQQLYELYDSYRTSDYNKRMEVVQKLDSAYPYAPRVKLYTGTVYSEGNVEDKAREYYEKAIQLDTGWVASYRALAWSYINNDPKNFNKAQEYAEKIVKILPDNYYAIQFLGDCYRALDNLPKAREMYAKGISLNPTSSLAYYKLGHINSFLGNYDEAKKNYTDGIKYDNSDVLGNNFIGYINLYAGKPKDAVKWFREKAVEVDKLGLTEDKANSRKTNYYYNCMVIAFHSGDAATTRDMVVLMEPIDIQAAKDAGSEETMNETKANSMQFYAVCDAMNNRFDASLKQMEEVKKIREKLSNPTRLANYDFGMGYIMYAQKKYDEAIKYFSEALQNDVYNRYWLAKSYLAAGKKDLAMPIFKEVSINNFNSLAFALTRNEVKDILAKEGSK